MTSTKPVIVTTARGVFFGYLDGEPTSDLVRLTRARNCIRWRSTRGFLGLASAGPNDRCRIGPAADLLIVYGPITSVAGCSAAAVAAWEAAPWSA